MILRVIRVKNFRQISGEYRIAFAAPGDRNVTVVLGENGSGKSTLLNAFCWCLYGKVELENPKELLSHHAVFTASLGAKLSVEVELQFEHNGKVYTAIRTVQYEKISGGVLNPIGEEVFDIRETATNGETRTIQDPVGLISNLLPQTLSEFFFFQGESIRQLALQRSRDKLSDGVETFLDFKVVDRAIEHIGSVQTEFERELRASERLDVASIQEKIDKSKADIASLESSRKQTQKNIEANKSSTDVTKQRLSEVEDFRPFLQEISTQEARLKELRNQRVQARQDVADLISNDGFLAFARQILKTPVELADAAVERGELPAKIKPLFVTHLLDKGMCVCDRPIDEGARKVLEKWRDKTGLADLEETVAGLRSSMHSMANQRRQRFLDELPNRREKIALIDEQIRDAEEKKSAAERQVRNVNLEQDYIRQLQTAYDDFKNQLVELMVAESRYADDIARQEKVLDQLIKERVEVTRSDESAKLIEKRIAAAKNVEEALSQIRENWTSVVQQYLDTQLKKTWKDIAQLPRRVSFKSDFTLSIEERGGDGEWVTSAPSEANCAVLALTFVSSLISFAKEIAGEPDHSANVFAGGEFPLVMDAPFAKMDVDFKQKVPGGLAEVVPQVVLICSLDQWQGDVSQALAGTVSKAYVLTLHKPGEAGEDRTISAFGRRLKYVVTDVGGFSDWTEIEEVRL